MYILITCTFLLEHRRVHLSVQFQKQIHGSIHAREPRGSGTSTSCPECCANLRTSNHQNQTPLYAAAGMKLQRGHFGQGGHDTTTIVLLITIWGGPEMAEKHCQYGPDGPSLGGGGGGGRRGALLV